MNYNLQYEHAVSSAKYIKQTFKGIYSPQLDTAIILGSGLGEFTQQIEIIASIPYKDIPNFPAQHGNIAGHKGRLSIGKTPSNQHLLIMEGRVHYYEGYLASQVVFPIIILNCLNISNLIITNAAGGINPAFNAGDLMLITDHINLTGNHPLIGQNNDKLGPRFLDQTEPYNANLIAMAKQIATKHNICLQEGVYIGISGPTYETKAEIRAFKTLGADAVGMSTIFEVIVANYFNMKVLGISSITNLATGIATEKHQHSKILETMANNIQPFSQLIFAIISQLTTQ